MFKHRVKRHATRHHFGDNPHMTALCSGRWLARVTLARRAATRLWVSSGEALILWLGRRRCQSIRSRRITGVEGG
jgi:hypothetical protein